MYCHFCPPSAERLSDLLRDTESNEMDLESMIVKIRDAEEDILHLAAHFISREKKPGRGVDRVLCQ